MIHSRNRFATTDVSAANSRLIQSAYAHFADPVDGQYFEIKKSIVCPHCQSREWSGADIVGKTEIAAASFSVFESLPLHQQQNLVKAFYATAQQGIQADGFAAACLER